MSRISLPAPESMNPAQRQVYEAIVKGPRARLVGPLRAALHNPELADRWQRMGALLRFGTSIPPKLSELAILVTARHWNSQLEWYIHAGAGKDAGLSQAVIDAVAAGSAPSFETGIEASVYEFARQLQQHGSVSDEVYRDVLEAFQEVGVVELAAIVGYYAMVAMTLNVHQIPLPDEGAEPPLRPVDGDAEPAPGQGGLTGLPQAGPPRELSEVP
jgi:4-carboxymuconolactone decarboxylase